MQREVLAGIEQRHILHIAYYEGLLKTRAALLERSGFRVSSALGNEGAMLLARELSDSLDLVVIGFSAPHQMRTEMLRWCRRHLPEIAVVVLQAHSTEAFPEADCVTLSEDPQVWLAAVKDCRKRGSA